MSLNDLEFKDEPITNSSRVPLKLKDREWLDLNIPFGCLVNGQPRSGKTKLLDWFDEIFYKNGIFTIWLYSALGFENLFSVINKHCKERWKKQVEENPELANKLPACQCYGTIPILWMVPNYFEVDQASLDRFNGVYWKNWDEYNNAYLTGNKELNTYLPPNYPITKLKKPIKLRPYPLLKVQQFIPPVTDSQIPEFRKTFYEMVKTCKKEHRKLVHTPAVYTSDSRGKKERFHTVAEVLRYIQDELCEDPLFDKIDNPNGKWERANHKIGIICSEFRGMCPNTQFVADTEATIARRACYAFMPEKRHAKTIFVADCQSSSDLYDKVRMQFSEMKIFKRTTSALIGAENQKFMEMIDKNCESYYESWGYNPKNPPYHAKVRLLDQFNQSKISDLPLNKMIIKLENGEYIIKTVKHALYHHKDDKLGENFFTLTGIKYKRNREKQTIEKDKEKASRVTKKSRDDLYRIIQTMRTEGKGFPEIIKHFLDKNIENKVENSKWLKETPKNLSNKYNNWKNNENKKYT